MKFECNDQLLCLGFMSFMIYTFDFLKRELIYFPSFSSMDLAGVRAIEIVSISILAIVQAFQILCPAERELLLRTKAFFIRIICFLRYYFKPLAVKKGKRHLDFNKKGLG